jgi:hypothetical protein
MISGFLCDCIGCLKNFIDINTVHTRIINTILEAFSIYHFFFFFFNYYQQTTIKEKEKEKITIEHFYSN